MSKYILALDQGTTSSRAILFDKHQNVVATAQKEFTQIFPKEGWVEHDAMELYASQYSVMIELLTQNSIDPKDIDSIGIANQRETTILWDKNTGKPIYNAIVWQCRRTAEICNNLKAQGWEEYIKKSTGLVVDAYFSATKIKWILDHVEGARAKAEQGDILFGTVDTWLLWKMTGGKAHITDYTNASRTMLYNIQSLEWDEKILKQLDIPRCILPQVCPSSQIYGTVNIQGTEIPIAGMAGDQQAALFGQGCFEKGQAKNTYGTGCFLLLNTGDTPCFSESGLLTTIAIGLEGKIQYALEGSVFIGGAVIQWLRDEMRFIAESRDAEYYAQKVSDTGGVYVVPAFTGLGAPYWDMYARGCIVGITRGTKRDHIIRAAQESIAYQTLEVVHAMEKDAHIHLNLLNVDGGASRDNFLMQFQADILNKQVIRPKVKETTALGAAYLAGLATGFWKSKKQLIADKELDGLYHPNMTQDKRNQLVKGWQKAVGRSLNWAEE